ncbi:hypothetical protein [Natronoglomus mannanivorans]|uniref:Phage tail protein n=1 Tax=Natronoglomus mannanivorans TaxID=2979990 RepID=A0AAP3E3U8_9EURY|nr:hypothetical protein [Halobacteria archaeon AArc-xg1-1]
MSGVWRLRKVGAEGYGTSYGESYSGPVPVDDDLEAVTVRDTINPFANKAEVTLFDPDSVKPAEYPKYTLVELDVAVPGFFDFRRRFAGFVIDHSRDRNETEMLILSYDFFLRKSTVRASYIDESVSSILEDLITRFTPLIWTPDLIDLENDPSITREWAGVQLVTALEDLVSISGGNELFGATYDREFYFRPIETTSAPRSFDAGEYFATSWDEDGKRVANRAVVRYGEGEDERVVAENDASAQRELGEAIGADGPVEIPIEKNHPEIAVEERARDKARQYLEQRSELQTGRIDTWEAFAVRPGQLVPVEDPENDIDDEFRVAEMEYEWPGGDPATGVTVADKRIDTADELVALSDDVQRLDLQDADPDAPFLETLEETTGATLTATASITAREFGGDRWVMGRDELGTGRTPLGTHITDVQQASTESARVTNTGLNAVRDGWRGGDVDPATTILLGGGDSAPSRNDTTLGDEIESFPATIALSGMQSARWSVTTRFVETTEIVEVGLENGGLYARVVTDGLEAAPLAPVDVSLRIDVDTDPEERGVTTVAGGETTRDVLAGNDPTTAVTVAFGTDDSPAAVTDSTLGNEIAMAPLDVGRTRGAGRTEAIARLDETIADGEAIAELAQLTDDGTALTRIVVGPILKSGFELEANQIMQFSNP